jgi:hypothetical protein
MKAIIIVMLIVQAGVFLATAATVISTRTTGGQRPVWSTFTIALVVASGASWNIGNDHAGQPGADVLMYGSPFLLGMGVMAALLMIRHRRGLDRGD